MPYQPEIDLPRLQPLLEATFGRDRMRYYDQLQRYQGPSYPPPNDDVTDWCVWVLRRFAIEIATAIGIIEWWNRITGSISESRTGRAIAGGLSYLDLTGSVSSREYARVAGVSSATAVAHLNTAVTAGVARREGRGPSTRYVSVGNPAENVARDAYTDAVARLGEP